MAEESGQLQAGIRHFSGEGTDAARDYRAWKRWSKAYLQVQGTKGVSETEFGRMLYTCIAKPALTVFEDIEPEDLMVHGGEQLVWDRLDRRYPERKAQDRNGDDLQAVFPFQAVPKERTNDLTGRAQTAFSKAQREETVLPSEARAYPPLHAAASGHKVLLRRDRATVWAESRRYWEEVKVATAFWMSFPESLPSATAGVALMGGVDAENKPNTDFEEYGAQQADPIEALLTDLTNDQYDDSEDARRGEVCGNTDELSGATKCSIKGAASSRL